DFDGADLGHTADVVACQVDEHHVFGPLLGVGNELGFQADVFFRGGAALAGARQGANGDQGARGILFGDDLLAHQNFRRGTHDMEVVEVPVVHVGGRVQ